ncbi:CFI-box-CTERM domain-containing protein [Chryseobacterium binzhouense]|uniref:CFI-box-CTERM domain-containing protein n=1 Tax=Chryseobacterium binzhouense TaxID=2593646 RepID=UPI00117C4A66|nr:CFI-box-CTERM domain-containing protein [Chryseobacterium binzhouense]
MKSILNNPYRITGLLVGATAREQDRQVRRLKQYIEAEQEPDEDYSFPILGELPRTIADVESAVSKLNLDSDKMSASLFWFYKGNTITDEPAFEALKDGDIETAYQIWDKLITDTKEDGKRFWKPVTEKNYSAFHNCAVLNIIRPNGNLNNAIAGGIFFLESDLVHNFVSTVADSTYKPSKKDLQLSFLNQLFSDIEYNRKISVIKFVEIVSKLQFSAKQDFLKSFVQKPIEQVERLIEESKTKRKANKANAVSNGNTLYQQTIENIKQLKSILGASDIKFSSVSDKVADEILQCGIDYFKHYRDSNTDPSSYTMDLFRKAKSLALGSVVRQRIQENTESLQEWIDTKPEREKQQRIAFDFERLKNLIDEFERKSDTVSNAKQLLNNARPYLSNVKTTLGSNDEIYLGLSSRIASDAQGKCVSEINKLQEQFSKTYDNATKLAAIFLLKERVNEAWEVSNTISAMDLRADFRTRVNQNKNSLSGLKSQLSQVNTGGGRNTSSGSGGCYIATMAYGSYDHPQVLELRRFRDEVLNKTVGGKLFIKAYYFISPKLVSVLKNQTTINSFIRKTLNQFIKIIR